MIAVLAGPPRKILDEQFASSRKPFTQKENRLTNTIKDDREKMSRMSLGTSANHLFKRVQSPFYYHPARASEFRVLLLASCAPGSVPTSFPNTVTGREKSGTALID
jgi:hypothetical protein